MTIFTIGYEGLSIEDFISSLSAYGIETVVDIRELPLSRKPGFSKRALADFLNLADFGYVHMAALGCPRPVRDRYRLDGDWQRYAADFMAYLSTQNSAIAELSVLAGTSTCALLCFEADFNFCHRSMVASAVKDYSGAAVQHIKAVRAKTKAVASSQLVCA